MVVLNTSKYQNGKKNWNETNETNGTNDKWYQGSSI